MHHVSFLGRDMRNLRIGRKLGNLWPFGVVMPGMNRDLIGD